MRIGLNAFYRLSGGSLTHLLNLLNAWRNQNSDRKHQLTLFLRAEMVDRVQDLLGEETTVETLGGKKPVGNISRLFWEQTLFLRMLRRARLDVLFSPGSFMPLASPLPTVVAFRNAAPFCASVNAATVGATKMLWFRVLGVLMRLSARRAKRVIFVSNYFQRMFSERFQFPLDRGDVIYNGNDSFLHARDGEIADRYEIRHPFFLFASELYPFRNVLELLIGFREALQSFDERIQVVIAGAPQNARYYDRLIRLVDKEHLQDHVIFLGQVPPQAIAGLLSRCRGYVFPSTCENCPNALIEALGAAVPIACSEVGVMPEICSDAALYFDPFLPSSIAEQLVRIANDSELRKILRARSRERAKMFPSWADVAAKTLDVLERAVDKNV